MSWPRQHSESDLKGTVLRNKREILYRFLGTEQIVRCLSHNREVVDQILSTVKSQCEEDLRRLAKASVHRKYRNEKRLHDPLIRIMETIQSQACSVNQEPHIRQILPKEKDDVLTLDDPIHSTSPHRLPDFLLIDVPPRGETTEMPDHLGTQRLRATDQPVENKFYGPHDVANDVRLRNCSSFITIKAGYRASPAYGRHDWSGSDESVGSGVDASDLDEEVTEWLASDEEYTNYPSDNAEAGIYADSESPSVSESESEDTSSLDDSDYYYYSDESDLPMISYNPMDTLAEGADYAQMILSRRPFQLFVYGIFVSGHRFCVGYFDRCGIVLSPDMPLTTIREKKVAQADSDPDEGLRTFIRIVLRLTFEMTPVDLGQDPTVKMVAGDLYARPSNAQGPQTGGNTPRRPEKPEGDGTKSLTLDDYPRFEVRVPQGDVQGVYICTTVGPPVWTPHSELLYGCGTWVWHVWARDTRRAGAPPTASMLKLSWRTTGGMNGYHAYGEIKRRFAEAQRPLPTALGQLLAGGDMKSDNAESAKYQSFSRLRGSETLQPARVNADKRLQCVLFSSIGVPVWCWESLEELVAAIRDVAGALDQLHEQGVLHRDISAGNVLIRASATHKPQKRTVTDTVIEIERMRPGSDQMGGLLTDFEFASFLPAPSEDEETAKLMIEEKRPGDGLTGTLSFMSLPVLSAAQDRRIIRRTLNHDRESLCWVALWALYMGADRKIKGIINGCTNEVKKVMRDEDATRNQIAAARLVKTVAEKYQKELKIEFNKLFTASSAQELGDRRISIIDREVTRQDRPLWSGIAALTSFARQYGGKDSKYQEVFIKYLWVIIGKMPPNSMTPYRPLDIQAEKLRQSGVDTTLLESKADDMERWLTEALENIRKGGQVGDV